MIVLDEQLLGHGIEAAIARWYPGSVRFITELREEQAKKVSDWATKVIPGPDDQNLIKSRLLRGDTVKILTPLQIDIILNRRRQERIAKLSLIGIEDAHVSEELVVKYPGLAKQGMWGITELINTPDGVAVASFRPMQATVDLALWKSARREFDLVEWRSLLILSMGYAPEAFTEDEQYLMLCRLLPLVQKNMHLIGFTDDSCAKLGGNVTPGGCGMR